MKRLLSMEMYYVRKYTQFIIYLDIKHEKKQTLKGLVDYFLRIYSWSVFSITLKKSHFLNKCNKISNIINCLQMSM